MITQLGDIPDSGLYVINANKQNINLEKFKHRVPNPVWDVLAAQFNSEITDNDMITDEIKDNRDINDLMLDLENDEWIIRDSAVLAIASLKETSKRCYTQIGPTPGR